MTDNPTPTKEDIEETLRKLGEMGLAYKGLDDRWHIREDVEFVDNPDGSMTPYIEEPN